MMSRNCIPAEERRSFLRQTEGQRTFSAGRAQESLREILPVSKIPVRPAEVSQAKILPLCSHRESLPSILKKNESDRVSSRFSFRIGSGFSHYTSLFNL
jgi:hypothetical protein